MRKLWLAASQSLAKENHLLWEKIWWALVIMISFSVWSWLTSHNLSTSYNDSMAHLNIARLVVDNRQTGLAQLGSVWLPLNHVLTLPLVWLDWAWQTSFAGSIVSMVSYVVTIWSVKQIVWVLSKDKTASYLAALVTALNLNFLYLQSTPLTEPLFIGLFSLSVYFFLRWVRYPKLFYLPVIGLLGFALVLTRYDGWLVVLVQGLLILWFSSVIKHRPLNESIGVLLIFAFPVVFGAGLWFLWNLVFYSDPLYFAFGEYSAHAQQSAISERSDLLTENDWFMSIKAYLYAILSNVGGLVTVLALAGSIYFFDQRYPFRHTKIILLILLMTPILFNILALEYGFSVINLPQLNWNPSPEEAGRWFNVRYGILALPWAAIAVGLLAAHKQAIIKLVVLLMILLQMVFTAENGIITLIDGTIGSSAFKNYDLSDYLAQNVETGQGVLLATSYFSPVAYKSGLNLKEFVHEGVSSQWDYALVEPSNYVEWIVMSNGNIGEPVHQSLIVDQQSAFEEWYELVFSGEHGLIYRRKTPDKLFVRRQGNQLKLNSADYKLKGVNSYDLAYRSESEIEETFRYLANANVNVVRFWAFGDGQPDGFQPEPGEVNEARLAQMDIILREAKENNIRVIPTLTNNWQDYGGKSQYADWIGKSAPQDEDSVFFVDQNAINLYQNYLAKVIKRENILTGIAYDQDPTILAWDLINEPRIWRGQEESLQTWARDTAQYVRHLDSNHLIMIGTERIYEIDQLTEQTSICVVEQIDICSIHLYFTHEDEQLFADWSSVVAKLEQQKSWAQSWQKPLVIEEVGASKQETVFNQSGIELLNQVSREAVKLDYDGLLIWNWSIVSDDSFGFSPDSTDPEAYSLASLRQIFYTW